MKTRILIILLSLTCACYVLCDPPPYISSPAVYPYSTPLYNEYIAETIYEFYGTATYYVYDPEIDDYDSGTQISHSYCSAGIGGLAFIGLNERIKSSWEDEDHFNINYKYSSYVNAIFIENGAENKDASMAITVLTTILGDATF